MRIGIAVMVCKGFIETNPECIKAVALENEENIEVTLYMYPPASFKERYPKLDPETEVAIYCSGIYYANVEEFKKALPAMRT